MTFKDFCKRYDDIKIKYDIIVLAEILKLYKEYEKEKYTLENTFNELHDEVIYTEGQKQYIIKEAEKLSKEQSN
ncbi:MAG: hypothetical protein ACI4VT_05170 [Bacilli bacterium]